MGHPALGIFVLSGLWIPMLVMTGLVSSEDTKLEHVKAFNKSYQRQERDLEDSLSNEIEAESNNTWEQHIPSIEHDRVHQELLKEPVIEEMIDSRSELNDENEKKEEYIELNLGVTQTTLDSDDDSYKEEYEDYSNEIPNIGGRSDNEEYEYYEESRELGDGKIVNPNIEDMRNRRRYRSQVSGPDETSVTVDNWCWVSNSRISRECRLIRCDFLVRYNSTFSPQGFACMQAKFQVDGKDHVYRNCVHTVSSRYDPCEALVLGADSPRVNILSCKLCWDNGCNMDREGYLGPFVLTNSWLVFLFAMCFLAILLYCCLRLCRNFVGCKTDPQIVGNEEYECSNEHETQHCDCKHVDSCDSEPVC